MSDEKPLGYPPYSYDLELLKIPVKECEVGDLIVLWNPAGGFEAFVVWDDHYMGNAEKIHVRDGENRDRAFLKYEPGLVAVLRVKDK